MYMITHRHGPKSVLEEYVKEDLELVIAFVNHLGFPLSTLNSIIRDIIIANGYVIEKRESNSRNEKLSRRNKKQRRKRNIVGGLYSGKIRKDIFESYEDCED